MLKHEAEMRTGQLPITKEDIQRIPDIVANPDKIDSSGKN